MYEGTPQLVWADLRAVFTVGNDPASEQKKSRIRANIPIGSAGITIPYTRWHPNDLVGDGYYRSGMIFRAKNKQDSHDSKEDSHVKSANKTVIIGAGQ